jgi:hypothetical protein
VPTTAISEKTTYITKPLTPDGLEIDVIGAITERFSPKCKPDENGFRYVIERFGIQYFLNFNDLPNLKKDISDTITKQLEISNIEPSVTYLPIVDYFIKRFESIDKENTHEQNIVQEDQKSVPLKTRVYDAISLLCKKSWNENTVIDGVSVTDAIRWLEANREALDEFGKAVRFPVYYAPMLTSQNNVPMTLIPSYEYTFHKEIVRGLRVRIMYRLGIGDFEKAKYDVMTIIKLADGQMRHFGTSTGFLLAGSMLSSGKYAVLDLIRFGNLTKQQLEQLQHDLDQYRTMPDFDDLMFIIRMQNIDSLYYFSSLRILDVDPNTKNDLTPFEIEQTRWGFSMFKYFGWTQEFAKQQARLDRLEKLLGNGFSRKQLTAFNEQCEKNDWLIGQAEDDHFYKLLIFCFWKGFYQVLPAMMGEMATASNDIDIILWRYRMEMSWRLLDIAFALELYRHDHGQYPALLEELAGKYIETIPDDPYTDGEPFHYYLELQQNAGYLLYSVGANGNDDNGVGWGYGDCNKTQEPSTDGEADNKNITDQKQSDKPPKSGDDIRIRICASVYQQLRP